MDSWRRIGVFGGTFDPPHVGHLVTAVNVRYELHLDVVLLVVANDPWQKRGSRQVSPAADRLAMVAAAVGDVAGLEVSDIEIRRGGTSYTADTLAELREVHPDAALHLVLGSDAAAGLLTWERHEEVREAASIAVVTRPGAEPASPPPPPRARRARAGAGVAGVASGPACAGLIAGTAPSPRCRR